MSWRDDLNYGLAAFGMQIPDGLDFDERLAAFDERPATNLAKIVAASAVVFYLAERGHNPKVKSIYDALIYTSTCLSVGYADVLARTPIGKMIGTALMTYGPALAAKAADGRSPHDVSSSEQVIKDRTDERQQQDDDDPEQLDSGVSPAV